MYVVRFLYNHGELKLADSTPCQSCSLLMKQVGLKTVVFSNARGELESCRVSELIGRPSTGFRK